MPSYYPVFLDLRGRECVIIGGGEVSEHKLGNLLDCGAQITIISPQVTPGIRARAEKGEVVWKARPYQAGDLKGAFIAIAATDDNKVNRAVTEEAREEKVLLNVADVTHLCMFIAPAIVKRGEVTVAISTGGASPALARRLREQLQKSEVLEYADLVEVLRDARTEVKRRRAQVHPDRWQECIDEQLLRMAQNGDKGRALDRILSCLLSTGVKEEASS